MVVVSVATVAPYAVTEYAVLAAVAVAVDDHKTETRPVFFAAFYVTHCAEFYAVLEYRVIFGNVGEVHALAAHTDSRTVGSRGDFTGFVVVRHIVSGAGLERFVADRDGAADNHKFERDIVERCSGLPVRGNRFTGHDAGKVVLLGDFYVVSALFEHCGVGAVRVGSRFGEFDGAFTVLDEVELDGCALDSLACVVCVNDLAGRVERGLLLAERHFELVGVLPVHGDERERIAVDVVALEFAEVDGGDGIRRAVVYFDVERGDFFALDGVDFDFDFGAERCFTGERVTV